MAAVVAAGCVAISAANLDGCQIPLKVTALEMRQLYGDGGGHTFNQYWIDHIEVVEQKELQPIVVCVYKFSNKCPTAIFNCRPQLSTDRDV